MHFSFLSEGNNNNLLIFACYFCQIKCDSSFSSIDFLLLDNLSYNSTNISIKKFTC